MVDGILIDERGRRWPDRSWELMRRLGRVDPKLPLSTFAVRERGFIHIRPQGNGARVALRVGGFELATLAGALYELKERHFPRIILAMLVEEEWLYEMVGGVWEFAERAEQLLAGGPVTVRHPWLAADRDLAALGLPDFALVRPLVELWRSVRGRLPDDMDALLFRLGLLPRALFVRQPPGSSRLVYAHFGSGIEFMRPCETLLMVGRDIDELPDREYGSWTAHDYAESLSARRPRLQSIRATIRMSQTTAAQGRYDRLTLPWRGRGNDDFLMGISLTRKHRCVVEATSKVG
jgi:hypothetical protein